MRVVKDLVEHKVAAAHVAEADAARAVRHGLRQGPDERLRLGALRRRGARAPASGAVGRVLRRRRRRAAGRRRRRGARSRGEREAPAVGRRASREAECARVAFDRVQNEVHEAVDALLVRGAPALALALALAGDGHRRGRRRRVSRRCAALHLTLTEAAATAAARARGALVDDEIECVVQMRRV